MITFLHKYQRALTLAISVCVISTFIFFGTSRAFIMPNMDGQDDVVYSCEAGKMKVKLTRQQMRQRELFLSSEVNDGQDPREVWSAALNLGFISEFILETGLGEQIIERDLDTQAWLKDQWQKESRWTGYRHPQLSYLNYGAMLSQINPGYYRLLKQWQQTPSDNLAKAKIELWLQSRQMPFQAIRSLVHYQEKSASVAPDASLDGRSMQPFGYQSLQDWFGPRFCYLCVQLICQGAAQARSMGYEISPKQVEAMLGERIEQLFTSYQQSGANIPFIQFKRQLLQNIGMEWSSLVELWTEVALFERLCFHEGGRILTDSMVVDKMARFLAERTQIESYEVPQEFQIRNLREMGQLQLYWNLTSGLDLNSESLPKEILTVNDLGKRSPELIAKKATLNVRHLSLDQVRRAMGVKALLTLEAQDKVWELLVKENPELAKVSPGDSQSLTFSDKLSFLSSMNPQDREALDRVALRWLAHFNPDNLRELLAGQEVEEKVYTFPLAAIRQPLEGIANARELFEKLHDSPILSAYTQEGHHFYAIELKSPVEEERLSFMEAKSSGILEGLFTKRMQTHYESMKASKPLAISKDGSVQAFKAVQDLVIVDFFQSLLMKIAQSKALLCEEKAPISMSKVDEAMPLVAWRFTSYLKQEQERLEKGDSLEVLPWTLTQTSPVLSREDVLHMPLEGIFKLEPGQWLPLVVAGKPTGRLVRCVAHSSVKVDPFTLDDQLHEVFARPLDRFVLKSWFDNVTLDTQLSFLQRP